MRPGHLLEVKRWSPCPYGAACEFLKPEELLPVLMKRLNGIIEEALREASPSYETGLNANGIQDK